MTGPRREVHGGVSLSTRRGRTKPSKGCVWWLTVPEVMTRNDTAAQGSLLGTLIGDSLGLPYEGLKAGRNLRIYPFPIRQRMFVGRGFASDDTLQSVFVWQAILASDGDLTKFSRQFARRLRTWFLAIPPGVGLSTVKACLRLCAGLPSERSGVRSAGNGAAMRSAVLGAAFSEDPERRVAWVEAVSRVTHTDPTAIQGAQLIALAAAVSARGKEGEFDELAARLCPAWPWQTRWPDSGPTGWVVHSVNAAIEVWKQNPDPVDAMEAVIRLGGDTDSVGAMVGGILGAKPGVIWPDPWLRIVGWPRPPDLKRLPASVSYFRLLAGHVAQLLVVLGHGFRRLLPPY